MKYIAACSCIALLVCVTVDVCAAPQEGLITRKTSEGTVVGYQDTPLMPWTGDKYHVHDPDRPIPQVVIPQARNAGPCGPCSGGCCGAL